VYYIVIKHSGHLRTLEKCRKHSPAACVFYISLMFSNARRVLSQCNTRLRLLYLLIKPSTPDYVYMLISCTRALECTLSGFGNFLTRAFLRVDCIGHAKKLIIYFAPIFRGIIYVIERYYFLSSSSSHGPFKLALVNAMRCKKKNNFISLFLPFLDLPLHSFWHLRIP